jgi:hypothetical protein
MTTQIALETVTAVMINTDEWVEVEVGHTTVDTVAITSPGPRDGQRTMHLDAQAAGGPHLAFTDKHGARVVVPVSAVQAWRLR